MKWLSQIWWTSLSHNPGWAIAEQTSCYTSQSSDAWLSTWKRNEINLTQPLDTWSLMAISLSSKEVFNSFIMLSIFITYISRSKKPWAKEIGKNAFQNAIYIFKRHIYDMWWFLWGFPATTKAPRGPGICWLDGFAEPAGGANSVMGTPTWYITYRKNSNGNRKSQPWMRRCMYSLLKNGWGFLKLSC